MIQAASQLEETRRALEAATATGDRDLLRSLVSDCAPLERVVEALARAKEALVAEPGVLEAPQDGGLATDPDPNVGDELGASIVRTIEEGCLAAVQDLGAWDGLEDILVRPTDAEDDGVERIEDLNAGEELSMDPVSQDTGGDLAPANLA